MTSYLTEAANAVARDTNKPTKAEIEAYIGNVMDSLRALPDVDDCVLGFDHFMFADIMNQKSYAWKETLTLGAGVEIVALKLATNFKPATKDGNLLALEISYPCSPTSTAGIEIKACFDPCVKDKDCTRIKPRDLRNEEARYKPVRGTWSERAEVLKEFARLLIEFGSPSLSKALRPIETPVNAFEDALRAQPR